MSALPIGVSERAAKRKVRRKSKAVSVVSSGVTRFVVLVGATYLASSLLGEVMVEKAHLESIRATERAIDAGKVVNSIENRLNETTDLNAIDEWAHAHNFYSLAELSPPATAAAAGAKKEPQEISALAKDSGIRSHGP